MKREVEIMLAASTASGARKASNPTQRQRECVFVCVCVTERKRESFISALSYSVVMQEKKKGEGV